MRCDAMRRGIAGSAQTPSLTRVRVFAAGKTSFCVELAARYGLQHVNVGDLAAANNCYDGYDEERACHILDDDKVGAAMPWLNAR